MTSPPREIKVVCPGCGHTYADWYRPSINLGMDYFDADYLDRASSAVCPACGLKVYFDQLVVRDDVFYHEDAPGKGQGGGASPADDTTAAGDHPVELLFRQLPQVEPYPPGVIAVPARIPGTAFFPGGSGLWGAEAGEPLPPMPVGGVMVLGHDFHSETAFQKSLMQRTEVPAHASRDHRIPLTWLALRRLLVEAEIPLTDCFFTNAYTGLRKGSQSTGRFPGAADPEFVRRCQEFLILQIETQRPSLVLTLGVWVPAFLASLSPQLVAWRGAQSFKAIDLAEPGPVVRNVQFSGAAAPPCTVVALTHPALRGPNLRHRKYHGLEGHPAEIAMLRDARRPK